MPWYISRAGQVLGPIEDEALDRQIEAGDVRANELLARPGDAAWLPAARAFPGRFPSAGRGWQWLAASLLVVFAAACWTGFAALTVVHLEVADPEVAGRFGLATIGACAALFMLAVSALLRVRQRSAGVVSRGLTLVASLSMLAALPGFVMAVMMLRNTVDADTGVDAHHLSLNDQGEVLLLGGLGRTLVHDLEHLLADHAGELVLVLDNGGGLIDAAEAAGDLLRARGPFTARVDGECASACTLLLAAAERIELYSDSRIGLHRPSSVLGGELGIDTEVTIDTFTRHLSRAGFGAQALDAIRDVPADDMLWLEPATHAGVLPPFHLLDDEGQEIAAERRDVVLARGLLARDTPEAAEMLDLVHAAFPGHARARSQALLAAHTRQDGIDEAMRDLLHLPFDAALAIAPPNLVRAWLASLVKLDEHFEWASPAGACYDHARHPKARRVAMARATELVRGAADNGWSMGDAGIEGDAAGRAVWHWPVAYSASGPAADADCQALLAAARELSRASDGQLRSGLAQRLRPAAGAGATGGR